MKLNSKLAVVGVGGVLAASPAFAEGGNVLTEMTTAATTAITSAESAVGSILVAGLVITIVLWSYGKIKTAIRKN